MNDLLDIKRTDFGSTDHRDEVADFYGLDIHDVRELPKDVFKVLVIGLIKGRLQGKFEAKQEIDSEFKCIPIGMWNHRATDFMKILREEFKELEKARPGKESAT